MIHIEQQHWLQTINVHVYLSTWRLFSRLVTTPALTIQPCDVMKEALVSVPMSCNSSRLYKACSEQECCTVIPARHSV